MDAIFLVDGNIISAFLLVLVLYYTKKILKDDSKYFKILNMMTFSCIICACTEAVTEYCIATVTNVTSEIKILTNITALATVIFALVLSCLWLLFVHFYITKDKGVNNRTVLLMCTPMMIGMIILLSSPLTGYMYSLDFHDGQSIEYVKGPLYFGIVALETGYLISATIYVIAKRKYLSIKESLVLLSVQLIPLCGTMIQMVYRKWLLIFPCTSFYLLLSYIFLQDGLLKYDIQTGCLKKKTFEFYTSEELRKGNRNYGISYVILKDYEYVYKKFGKEEQEKYLVDFANLAKDKDTNLYELVSIGLGEFIIYFKTNDLQVMQECMRKIENKVNEFNKDDLQDRKYSISFIYSLEIFKDEYNKNSDLINAAYKNIYKIKNKSNLEV